MSGAQAESTQTAKPTLHFRPAVGNLADTIPFFWKGEYHIFYLRGDIGKVPWEHIVSENLVHWIELPTALVSDGDADGPDGEHMFTGSVIEHDGTFHIFYTGWNPRNKTGREWIMHATSKDSVKWQKHPELAFRADEAHYQNTDFRDPYVFWNEEAKAFWMILCARDAKSGKPVQGVATSTDLNKWSQREPLIMDPPFGDGTPECPDLFKIGGKYYLLHSPCAGTTDMRFADNINGPYTPPESPQIDTPILYAAKRMFDGRRHILSGWLRDLEGNKDGGNFRWGGNQSTPRELYAGENGQLLFRPVPEAVYLFGHTVIDLKQILPLEKPKSWAMTDGELVGEAANGAGEPCLIDTPPQFLLEASLDVSACESFSIGFRQDAKQDQGYVFTLFPGKQEAAIKGKTFEYPRKVRFDNSRPVTLKAFVDGSLIEVFLNDAYVFSARAYDHPEGDVALSVCNGKAKVSSLTIKTMNKE